MSNPIPEWKEVERAAYQLAHRFHSNIKAAGLEGSITVEDLKQELSLRYCICVEKFDPEAKVKFSTFFITSARNAMINYINRETRIGKINGKVLERMDDIKYDDSVSKYETVPSPEPDPCSVLEQEQELSAKLRGVSRHGRNCLNLMHERPDWLVEEAIAAERQVEHAKTKQVRMHNSNGISDLIVVKAYSRIMRLSDETFREIKREIRGLVA